MKKIFILLFSILLLTSCKEDDSETTSITHLYNPKIPYGTITNSTSLSTGLSNVHADVSTLNTVLLKWTVPPLYRTMNYKVHIYKRSGDRSAFEFPDPSEESSSAVIYLRESVQGSEFLDANSKDSSGEDIINIEADSQYTYWLYLSVEQDGGTSKWSPGVRLIVTTKKPTDTFKLPALEKFWEKIQWRMGYAPTIANNTKYVSVGTMDAGQPTEDAATGGLAMAYLGNVMYYADTQNNRVVIYKRGDAYTCTQFQTDPDLYAACVYQFQGAPMSATNILGQASQSESKTCSQHESICSVKNTKSSCDEGTSAYSLCSWTPNGSGGGTCSAQQKCLNKPTKVTVADNKLFISDTGNNRIVVYNTLPVKGCDKEIFSGVSQAIDCDPSFVIGKKGLSDTTPAYAVGNSSLSGPGGVAVKDNDLYIADTGNNRVVMIKSYADAEQFDCSDASYWGTTLCRFSGVLGQKDFVSRWTVKEGDGILTQGQPGYDGITCNSAGCSTPYQFDEVTGQPLSSLNNQLRPAILKTFMRKPQNIKFWNNALFVSTNESISISSVLGDSQLKSRILVYDSNPFFATDPCIPDVFSGEIEDFSLKVSCQATRVLGSNPDFSTLETVASANGYGSSPYGVSSIGGFDIHNNMLLSVDYVNNYIHVWNSLTDLDSNNNFKAYSGKVVNPKGIGYVPNTTLALPNLQSLSDIVIIPQSGLIEVSDSLGSKVYEVRSYEFEQ